MFPVSSSFREHKSSQPGHTSPINCCRRFLCHSGATSPGLSSRLVSAALAGAKAEGARCAPKLTLLILSRLGNQRGMCSLAKRRFFFTEMQIGKLPDSAPGATARNARSSLVELTITNIRPLGYLFCHWKQEVTSDSAIFLWKSTQAQPTARNHATSASARSAAE